MATFRTIRFIDLLEVDPIVKEITIDITNGQHFTDEEEVHYNQEIELEDIQVVEAFTTYEDAEIEEA